MTNPVSATSPALPSRELEPPESHGDSAPPWAERELRILLVEDNAPHAELVEHFLRESGLQFRIDRVDTQQAFVAYLERQPPDMILSDYGTTGDGLVAALQVLAVLVEAGGPASAVTRLFEPLPQRLKSVRFSGPSPLQARLPFICCATSSRRRCFRRASCLCGISFSGR